MIEMNKCEVGAKFLASVGKKKSRLVEILIIEWSSTGAHFKAEIRDGLSITFGWHVWTDYRFVELINGPAVEPKITINTAPQSNCEVDNEKLLDDASVEKLSFEAANAINNIVEYFPSDKQQEIRDTIFKLRSISELNDRWKFGLMNELYEDMISEFVSIWPNLVGKKAHQGMGVSVGSLTGRASGLAPKDGFLSIVEFIGPKAESKAEPKSEDVNVDVSAKLSDTSPIESQFRTIQSHFRNMMVEVSDCIGKPQEVSDYFGKAQVVSDNEYIPLRAPIPMQPSTRELKSTPIGNGIGDIGVYSKSTLDNNENIDSD